VGGIIQKRQEPSFGRNPKFHVLIMLVCVPAGIGLGLLIYILHGGATGNDIKRQFINCYVSPWPFVIMIVLMSLMFRLSTQLGAHPFAISARNRLKLLTYSIILVVLGIFFLKTPFLSHEWYKWSFGQRVGVAVTNFIIVLVVGGAYLLAFPIWEHSSISSRSKMSLLTALLLWGYLLASCVRMLPIPLVTGVE